MITFNGYIIDPSVREFRKYNEAGRVSKSYEFDDHQGHDLLEAFFEFVEDVRKARESVH